MLDTKGGVVDAAAMQALKSVPELVARLRKLSEKFGSKAALARKLDVSRQAVDQWLNGKTTPSTEIAIKVMNLE
jgi:DNA-binding XRE family transcriptional regulator